MSESETTRDGGEDYRDGMVGQAGSKLRGGQVTEKTVRSSPLPEDCSRTESRHRPSGTVRVRGNRGDLEQGSSTTGCVSVPPAHGHQMPRMISPALLKKRSPNRHARAPHMTDAAPTTNQEESVPDRKVMAPTPAPKRMPHPQPSGPVPSRCSARDIQQFTVRRSNCSPW
jgi:hypothetical protein